jgi:hypothetical protein
MQRARKRANTHTDTDTEHGAPRADPRCFAISSKWITCSGHAWGGVRVHCSALKTLDCIPERLVAQDTSKGGPWQRLWVLERDALSSIACAPAPSAPATTSGVFGYMLGLVRATMGWAEQACARYCLYPLRTRPTLKPMRDKMCASDLLRSPPRQQYLKVEGMKGASPAQRARRIDQGTAYTSTR